MENRPRCKLLKVKTIYQFANASLNTLRADSATFSKYLIKSIRQFPTATTRGAWDKQIVNEIAKDESSILRSVRNTHPPCDTQINFVYITACRKAKRVISEFPSDVQFLDKLGYVGGFCRPWQLLE